MCLDRELNWWAFSFQAGAQSTEPHLPGREDIFYLIYFLIKKYFTDYVITIVPILLPWPLSTWYPLHSSNAPLSSCPWVMHISSLTSPFPILHLTSSCPFCTYQLCFLFPAPVPPFSPFLLPNDNPPNDLHIYDSVSALLVCLVCCFRFSCW